MGKLFIMIALGLSGCAAAPYGNFTTNTAPITLNDTLAADAMKRLEALYPPAATQFVLGQPTNDKFGAALVKALRTKGYAIMEYNPDMADKQRSALSLRYVLDTPMKGLYRLTVVAGTTPITRAYVEQNNTVAPAGAWVQREQ